MKKNIICALSIALIPTLLFCAWLAGSPERDFEQYIKVFNKYNAEFGQAVELLQAYGDGEVYIDKYSLEEGEIGLNGKENIKLEKSEADMYMRITQLTRCQSIRYSNNQVYFYLFQNMRRGSGIVYSETGEDTMSLFYGPVEELQEIGGGWYCFRYI